MFRSARRLRLKTVRSDKPGFVAHPGGAGRGVPRATATTMMRFANKPCSGLFVIALISSACIAIVLAVSAQETGRSNLPMATKDRVQFSSWWPTKGATSREEYVGPAACATCHPGKASSQKTTPMGNASSTAANSDALRAHNHLTYRQGPYHYEIASRGRDDIYSVTEAANSFSVALGWALGYNQVGQTYVYQFDGKFYESRVSYYRDLQGLDITPGHLRPVPSKFADAAGRLMDADETQQCFACHSTASTVNNRMDLSQHDSRCHLRILPWAGRATRRGDASGRFRYGRQTDFHAAWSEPRRLRRILRGVSSHQMGCCHVWHHRNAYCSLSALSPRNEQMLGRSGRCATDLLFLPRSAQAIRDAKPPRMTIVA